MDRDIARSIKPAVVIDDHSYIRASVKRLVPTSTYLNADVYAEIKKIAQDSSLKDLRGVWEWTQFLGYYSDSAIARNIHYNDSLSLLLNSAWERDQRIRLIIDSIYRRGTQQQNQQLIDSLAVRVKETDSLNLLLVSEVLDKYGWLGIEQVGEKGNKALFIIIQHADLNPKVQKKYLPLLKSAVQEGKAQGQCLALLEDRISLRETGKQWYGTQVIVNYQTGEVSPHPLVAPEQVAMLRASQGLPPLSYYLRLFTQKK